VSVAHSSRTVVAVLWLALLSALLPAASLRAQGPPAIDIRVNNGALSPSIAVRQVLSERAFDDLLRHGFPVRLHVRAEVWTVGGWFDEIIGSEEWYIVVRYDLIDKTYEVARVMRDVIVPLGNYARFVDARSATELPVSPTIRGNAQGKRGYIAVQVDAQAVEMSDLDEVQRWLRGEARPMVQGRRSPGTALGRGLRSLVSRLLGGEVRHLEARTPTMSF
jgi:hypothetical protein